MDFTVRTVYTQETVAALVALTQRRELKRRRFRRALGLAVGVPMTLLGAAGAVLFLLDLFSHLLSGRGYTWGRAAPVLAAGMLLWSGLSVLLEGPRLRRQRERLTAAIWRSYPDKGQETVFHFTAECFSYQTAVSKAQYSYAVLTALAEDGAYYYLYLNSTYAYVLKKADFVQGDPADFRAFLTRVTGKAVQNCGEEAR